MVLKKLDARYSLPGPLNWGRVLTGLVSAISIALLWFVWSEASLAYQVHHELPTQVAELQRTTKKVDRILALMQESVRRDLTVVGQVAVVSNGDHLQPCLWVNELSHASIHIATKRVKITNLDDPNRRTGIVFVRGTVSTPDQNCMGEICSAAAAMLHASGAKTLHVKIEPVPEDLESEQ